MKLLKASLLWEPYSVSTFLFHQYLNLSILPPLFTYSMLSAFSQYEKLDLCWLAYLFLYSLPAVQYPSPLHGHRWITRPGLAQFTELCCSSENTPLPSYSNGLCWPSLPSLWYTREDGERCRRKEGGWRYSGEPEVGWWEEESCYCLWGKQGCQGRNAVQTRELDNLEIQPSPRTPIALLLLLPPWLSHIPPCLMPSSEQAGRSSETGWHEQTLPLKSLKGNWAFQPTPLICATLPTS